MDQAMKQANITPVQRIRSIAGWALLIVVCSIIGTSLGNKISQHSSQPETILLKADTAVKGKTLSMATGLISPEVEGLYVLDHASGLLQCWLLNPRNGAVGGIYQTNIIADFGGGGKAGVGDYTMATGGFQFTGGVTANMHPAGSIVYVADESTGNVVGYSFIFNRPMLNNGEMQQGALTPVCKGPTRGGMVVERDQ
jgi:hypothetical protein